MSRMFGERIQEFVLSVDIMTEDTFHLLLDLINTYVKRQLDIVYFSVLEQEPVDGKPGLSTYWTTRRDRPNYAVPEDGQHESHASFSFGEENPLWVVSKSQSPLKDAPDLKDLWGNSEELPKYKSSDLSANVRTSVIHPLTHRSGRVLGVVEFAADRYVEPTPASLEEVRRLADVVSRAYQMFDVGRAQRQNTSDAIERLRELLESESWTRLALPQMFVAFAGSSRLQGGDRDVHEKIIESIRSVLSKFDRKIEAHYWDKVEESGNINEQVIREIAEAEFGLCYFSEPDPEGEQKYRDNPNVLFEAGMMQALRVSGGGLLRGWIPIREIESPDLPFDIAAERMLHTSRNDGGKVDFKKFEEELFGRVDALLESLEQRA